MGNKHLALNNLVALIGIIIKKMGEPASGSVEPRGTNRNNNNLINT